MASNSQSSITFDQLLLQYVEEQMQAIEHGKSSDSYLSADIRQTLLKQLSQTHESSDKPEPLFESASLKGFSSMFDRADSYYKRLEHEQHPAQFLFEDPKQWFLNSYRFMADKVSFLELLRFFAVGKTRHDKEIVFRSLVAKLIKTQETIRTIENNTPFLKKYLQSNPKFKDYYPSYLQKSLKLSSPLSPESSVLKGMQLLIRDISSSCLKLFKDVQLASPKQARAALSKKKYYQALILTMRHAPEDLFGKMKDEDYPLLIKNLSTIVERSLLHSESYLFQHVKREYLTDWLVHTLRDYDKKHQDPKNYFQAGKAVIYSKFALLEFPKDQLQKLKKREHLEDTEIIQIETQVLNLLQDHDFYELLLKVYMRYKDHHLIGKEFPISAQALASAGDISWEKTKYGGSSL